MNIHHQRVGLAAFQAFINIAQNWQLKPEQQRILLGNIPESTLCQWQSQAAKVEDIQLPKATLERISYILSIYKSLHDLLQSFDAANQWIHKPNDAPLLNGKTALEKMLAGNLFDLAELRSYLDAS